MPIFANTTQSYIYIDPTLIAQIPEGSTLIWDPDMRRFIPYTLPATAITNIVNVGPGDVSLIRDTTITPSNKIVNVRELKAGTGITLTMPTNDYILISGNYRADQLSVPGNYRITIDNDGNEPNSKFEIFTASQPLVVPIAYTPTPVTPITVTGLMTASVGGHGQFISKNGVDFFGLGVRPGQYIKVTGTNEQDGQWQVLDVTLTVVGADTFSTIILVQNFTGAAGFDLGGPQPTTTFEFADLYVPIADPSLPAPYNPTGLYKLQSVSLDFGPLGLNLLPGMILKIREAQSLNPGTTAYDGNYTIASVTPRGTMPGGLSTLLFTSGSPIPGQPGMVFEPDPNNPSITLYVDATEEPTGFSVTKTGDIIATKGLFTRSVYSGNSGFGDIIPVANNELTRKDYVDLALAQSKWNLLEQWDFSSTVASVPFLNLGVYSELMIHIFDLNHTSVSNASWIMEFSIDNGSTWRTTTGDYGRYGSTTGTSNLVLGDSLASTSKLGGIVLIYNFNKLLKTVASMTTGVLNSALNNQYSPGFTTASEIHNALRIRSSAGNIAAGSILIFGKR